MFEIDRWKEIYFVLKSNKLRTFLTAFGVFWGIFMLVVMLGSGNGLENGVRRGFADMATNSVFMWTQETTIPYKGFTRGRRFTYVNDDVTALKNAIPEIKYIAPRISGNMGGNFDGGSNVIRGLKTGNFVIMGDYPVALRIDPLNIVSGRFVNDIDIRDKRKVVVIGTRVKEILFKPEENPVGQYIQIQGVYFEIVGMFRSKRTGEQADRENQTIYMPFTTLQKTYNFGDAVGFFAITSKDGVPVSVVEKKAIEILKARHAVAPADDRAIGHFNLEEEFRKFQGLFGGIRMLVWIVGTGTLLAGIIGVSNIMLVVVKERTKEIGIMRAIGASPMRVITQIIMESVVLTTFAGYFGLALGVGLLEGINYLLSSSGGSGEMFYQPGVDFRAAVTALSILIFSGAVAGLIPARKAVSVKPIDALRYE